MSGGVRSGGVFGVERKGGWTAGLHGSDCVGAGVGVS